MPSRAARTALAALALWATPAAFARAQPATDAAPAPADPATEPAPPSGSRGSVDASDDDDPLLPDPLPSVGALVPGVVVHGTGHFLAGRPSTGWKLLAMEGIGLGLAVIGAVSLALTGANRDLSGPMATLAIAGGGLLHISHLADFVGVTFREDGPGRPDVIAPSVMTEMGYRFAEDPQFRYHHFLVQGLDLRYSRLRLNPTAWFALDDRNARIRVLGGVRLFGPLPHGHGPVAKDGSFVDLEIAGLHHGYRSDGFRVVTAELGLSGRLDLERIDPYLRGSFGELGTGIAAQLFDYDYGDLSLGDHIETMLLGRFAYGMYIGRPPAPHGELAFYYEHRHDDYVGGIPGIGIGIIGYFGLAAKVMLSESWGVASDVAFGSAFVGGLSLLYRNRGDETQ